MSRKSPSHFRITIPCWSPNIPQAPGTYLYADRFGRVALTEVANPGSKECMLRTTAGLVFLDPRMGPYVFCGPLTRADLFDAETFAKQEAAWEDLPAARVRDAEALLEQNPRSRRAKALVCKAKAEYEQHLADKAAKGK